MSLQQFPGKDRVLATTFYGAEAAANKPRRELVELGRVHHVQLLMRTLAVVALDEAIKACLLLQEVLRGRMRVFFLERQVHPLMTAILLDAFDAAPQPARFTAPKTQAPRVNR